MKIGIFGLPMTGKTTIFSLLTNTPYDGSFKMEAEEKNALIKDPRITKLSKMFNPKKTTYTTLNFVDIPSFDASADKKEKIKILQMIQGVDALLFIIRSFKNENVPFPDKSETVQQQLETLRSELLLRDLEVVENKLERIELQKKKKKPTADDIKEEKILNIVKEELENENFSSKIDLSDDDKKIISSLSLFTLKPIIVVANVDEEQFSRGYEGKNDIVNECKNQDFAYIEISGKIESDLIELDEDEKEIFMEEIGIDSPGIDRLSKIVYDHIGLISFFTVGTDEVRAWTINKGYTMKKAAGRIHSALEKNFIKAECMKYEDLIRLGTEEEVKKAGLWKLAGKDEIVEDGDILAIRANA
ncbi:ribosome-binding ATPase YchF [Tepiditoga spiralis]|uniref:Ribosome-binding ATPase YchF n=1 Tax=Tepiditoga spiralis TaxID=2108365 RepID=A0A7G1G9H6_9BACT|nr:DUF933 domain-containing protein [Tepiditoga spiralis]BBE31607.1 ribosome-binding ATPase YchF [Tepiditoga spiralis]